MKASRRAALGALVAGAGCLRSPRRTDDRPCPEPITRPTDVHIGFTGDVMLGRGVDERWSDGPPGGVWGNLRGDLRHLDGLLINLECCLADGGRRRPGRTYHFRADPDWAVPALRTAGVAWASLANNHVLDFGEAAFTATIDHLDDADIGHAGAGMTRDAAIEPSVIDVGGLSVAVIALTDRSPSYGAGADRAGTAFVRFDTANPVTRWLVAESLGRALASDPDLVVASLHWGPNWETAPSPRQRAVARWLIDRGVDVVHGHSAHVIQGVEAYRGRPIIYDAGDFVDDYAVKPSLHNDRSFLFEAVVSEGGLAGVRLRPIEIHRERVTVASHSAAAWLRTTMRDRSAAFGTTLRRDGRGLWLPLVDSCE